MKKCILSFMLGGLLVLASCSTVTKTATTVDVNSNINTYPEVVDLDIQPKVTQTMTWNFRPFHIGEPKTSTAKGNLLAETLKANNADIMLEPQFTFEKTSYGERVLVVTGFPATFKNFRKATAEDLEAIKACRYENNKTKFNSPSGKLFGVFGK